MFLRGQRVRIIKSNAKGRTHPREGDVGYLHNLFLFPADKFILADIFLCQYGGEEKRRIEHKKFILDIGLKPALKKEISRMGVNKMFFLTRDHLCLNPSFCRRITHKDNDRGKFNKLVQFPQLMSTHGMWTSYTKKTNHRKRDKDSTFVIPCGCIAADNLITGRKESITKMDHIEIGAWLNTQGPILAAMLQLYHDYYDRGDRNFRKKSDAAWEFLSRVIDIRTNLDNICQFKADLKKLMGASTATLQRLSSSMNLMIALSRVALHRSENSLTYGNDEYGTVAGRDTDIDTLKSTINRGYLLDLINPIKTYDSGFNDIPFAMLIATTIYRMFFVEHNVEMMVDRLKPFIEDAYVTQDLAKRIVSIQEAGQRDSAALNRIFDVLGSTRSSDPYAIYKFSDQTKPNSDNWTIITGNGRQMRPNKDGMISFKISSTNMDGVEAEKAEERQYHKDFRHQAIATGRPRSSKRGYRVGGHIWKEKTDNAPDDTPALYAIPKRGRKPKLMRRLPEVALGELAKQAGVTPGQIEAVFDYEDPEGEIERDMVDDVDDIQY